MKLYIPVSIYPGPEGSNGVVYSFSKHLEKQEAEATRTANSRSKLPGAHALVIDVDLVPRTGLAPLEEYAHLETIALAYMKQAEKIKKTHGF